MKLERIFEISGLVAALAGFGVAGCGDAFSGDCEATLTCERGGGTGGGGGEAGESTGGSSSGKSNGGSSSGTSGSGPMIQCESAADCDDGEASNGVETCGAEGYCVPGNAPPVVISISPAGDAQEVPLDAAIVLTFSEPLAADSVTGETIRLLIGDTVVDATLVVDGATVTITPAAPLELWSTYDVEVSDAITDQEGLAALEPYSSSFTSRDGAWTTITAASGTIYDIASSLPVTASGQVYVGYLAAAAAAPDSTQTTVRRFKEAKTEGAAFTSVAGLESPQKKRNAIDIAMSHAGSVAIAWAGGSSYSYVQAFNEEANAWLTQTRQPSATDSVSDIQVFELGWHDDGTASIFGKQNYDSFKVFVQTDPENYGPQKDFSPGPLSPFAMAFDAAGNGFAVWVQLDTQSRACIAASRYTKSNHTWGNAAMLPGSRAAQAGASYALGAPAIVMTDAGHAQVAWFAGGAGGIATLRASEYVDGAWTQPRLVSGETQLELVATAPALAINGDTFVAGWVASGSESGVHTYTATFDAAAMAWAGQVEHVSADSATTNPAYLAADARGNMMLVWTVDVGGLDRKLVYRRFSGQRQLWADVADVPEADFTEATGAPVAGPVHTPLGMNASGRAGLMWAVQTNGPSWNTVKVASFF